MYKKTIENATRILTAYLDDYRKGMHVRSIAKFAKISPSAASYMARDLEKQRILDHEVEGRNKKYFINFENPSAKNMLVAAEISKKSKTTEKYFIIKKMLKEVDFANCIALLFGSFAKGTANDGSDIDILLIGRNAAAEKSLEKFGNLYKKSTHVMSMNKNDFVTGEKREFVNEILKSHIVLNRTEEFVNMLWGYHA